MLFNSLQFILFFLLVAILYYIIPYKLSWVLLLISSYIFYMAWNPALIVLILFSTLTNYIIALKIYDKKMNKLIIISLLINFLLLFIFKYLVFISDSLSSLFTFFSLNYPIKKFSIILPVGISFYTFQAASYTIDVYKKRIKPERNFFKFSLFITFFPQLVAGPIERTDNLLPQLLKRKKFNIDSLIEGSKYMIMGYFKKIVIADRAAFIVDGIYNQPYSFTGLYFFIATILFAFQIYCDFSGYSDIAVGCAKILGIDLMKNFDTPYLSKNIQEFWRRWHISLSTWFKDYLYIPLGGNRVSPMHFYFNIFVTFAVSGLWHGANWTFVVWGILHGLYQIIGNITSNIRKKVKKLLSLENTFLMNVISVIVTFSFVCIGWIFFRANNIKEGFYILSNLTNDISYWNNIKYIYDVLMDLGVTIFEVFIMLGSIFILILIELFSYNTNIHELLNKKSFCLRFSFYYIITTLILCLGVCGNKAQFIYFQF